MYNPHYLTVSRHNVFYFRFPIPRHFHPQRKTTDIKLSLETRCPDEALQIARSLLYFADHAMKNSNVPMMSYQELRDTLHHHFKQMRDKVKERIAQHGRLNPADIAAYQNGRDAAAGAITSKQYELAAMRERPNMAHLLKFSGK